MNKKQELKFVFHNPNEQEETDEYLSKWIAKVYLPSIEKLIRERSDR